MEIKEEQSSYRKIMKGTTIFGGVQIFNIIINLVRSKFVAILLGPEGMGISALFTSTLLVFQQISGLGINTAAVKDISKAHENDNIYSLSLIIKIVRYSLRITSIIGCILLICFSSQISQFVFSDKKYTGAFVVLALALFFSVIKDGETAILQGSKRVKDLALSSLIGPIVGLLLGVPLYYFFGFKGIVPSIIILALFSYLFVYFFSKRIVLEKVKINTNEGRVIAKGMFSLGLVSMMAALMGSLTYFFLNAFISNFGLITDIGLYQASISLTAQSVGLVFAAMSADYYPRLAAIGDNPEKIRELVNQQSEIILLIIAPLIIGLIVATPILIKILLSEQYLVIIPVVRWMAFGLLFKGLSYPMGYISFSKGDKKFFFWFDGFSSNLVLLSFGIIGYIMWGIIGIGIAFCFLYIIYLLLYIIATKKRYSFYHSKLFLVVFVKIFPLVLISFLISLFEMKIYSYFIIAVCLVISLIISYCGLNERLNIKQLLKRN